MNYLNKNIKEFKNDLKKLIGFKTFLKDVYPNQEMKNALKFMQELAERDGMRSYIDPEGYYGYIEIGFGEELIGILTHIDVVPPGNSEEWNTPPFTLTEKDGRLYGRGTSDDKGPLMLLYYLMKDLNENRKLNKRIRLIFPTDEESKWRGVEKYNKLEEKISFGITPDSQFPPTFLEREILQVELTSKKGTNGWTINAGTAANVVPAKAIYNDGKGKEIVVDGRSSHAMKPELGDNAIVKLMKRIETLEHPMLDFIRNEVKDETNGETLFNGLIKDEYANITLNLAMANFNEEGSRLVLDSRIPITSNAKEIEEIYRSKAEKYGYEFKVFKQAKSVYFPLEHWLIKDIQDSYKEVMKEEVAPITSGGGTYAKSMDNVIACGALMPWSEHTEHQYNENIKIDDYLKAYDVYNNLFNKWLNKD